MQYRLLYLGKTKEFQIILENPLKCKEQNDCKYKQDEL